MSPIDCVEFVRQRRRGALNTVQLTFLMDTYKKQWTKKAGKKRSSSPVLSHQKESSGGIKESFVRFFGGVKKNISEQIEYACVDIYLLMNARLMNGGEQIEYTGVDIYLLMNARLMNGGEKV